MSNCLFKNIVGKINRSELFDFKLDNELTPESARYFLVKKALKNVKDENTGEEKQEYYSYVYSDGIHKDWNRPIETPRCLDMFGWWRFSFNDRDFRNYEMIEIDMNK